MKYYLSYLFVFILLQNIFSQNIEEYPNIQENAERNNIYSEYSISDINSDCGAYFDADTNTLTTEFPCKGKFWMENFPDFDNPYEFVMDFSINENRENLKSSYLLQIFLGNSPSGYTWLGVNSSGELLISYTDTDGDHDLLLVSKGARVEFNKNNHLKFVQFPDGTYYIELNSYSRWSYDLQESIQKIPLVGLSNRMIFKCNIEIFNLELNTFRLDLSSTDTKQDDFFTEMEDLSAGIYEDQLLGLDTDKEKLDFHRMMKMMSDQQCTGNCKNGFGIVDFGDGNQYMGYWKDNEFSGEGKLFTNGILYVNGNFENGVIHGYAEYYKDGELLFQGQWKNGDPIVK